MIRLRILLAAALFTAGMGCTSFGTVRSAAVTEGPSLVAQASLASPPGDAASWFWNLDCGPDCNRSIAGGDASVAYGRTGVSAPFTIGIGTNGVYPYLEGYVQLGRSRTHPAGIGARVGVPFIGSWRQHQLYGRVDIPVARDVTLLWNPGVVYHTGRSPNGENPGTFLGIVQAVGLQTGSGPLRVIPSVGAVWGRAERRSYGQQVGPESQLFGFGAVSVQYAHRP